jgi:ABC transporter substrate binding protein
MFLKVCAASFGDKHERAGGCDLDAVTKLDRELAAQDIEELIFFSVDVQRWAEIRSAWAKADRSRAPTPLSGRHLLSAEPGRRLMTFVQALLDLGYAEGQNISIEWRFSEGNAERFAGLAQELSRLDVDLIVAISTPAALAAKQATQTIPIVML